MAAVLRGAPTALDVGLTPWSLAEVPGLFQPRTAPQDYHHWKLVPICWPPVAWSPAMRSPEAKAWPIAGGT